MDVIKTIYRKSPMLQYVWRGFYRIKLHVLVKYKPEIIANVSYRQVFGRDVDWQNPKDLIEKIYWLQFNTDTILWTKCADKYRVRKYVEERGCKEILNELYGKWDNPKDIEWDKLPDSFVLKTNNGCGQIIIVKDKRKLNIPETTKILVKWMKKGYGYEGAQLHYIRIKPCIIAEKLFINKSEPGKSLIDYKIWCFHGVPECFLVVFNRTKNGYLLSSYDLEWNNISDFAFNKSSSHYSGIDAPKPESLQKMIEVARILAEGFPQVRVDFYDIDGEPVFGEMTFTAGYGSFSEEYYKYLGSKIDLSKVEKQENERHTNCRRTS